MTTRSEIVSAARRCLNTPARFQGRAIGAGLDCIGVWLAIADQLGLGAPDLGYYGDLPAEATIRRLLDLHMVRVWDASTGTEPHPLPGQLGLFRWGENGAIHMAVITDFAGDAGMLHSYAPLRKVVEHGLSGWRSRLVALYDVIGVLT